MTKQRNDPRITEAIDLCKRHDYSVAAWGPELICIEAKDSIVAPDLLRNLNQLGLKLIEDEDDRSAGLASFNFSGKIEKKYPYANQSIICAPKSAVVAGSVLTVIIALTFVLGLIYGKSSRHGDFSFFGLSLNEILIIGIVLLFVFMTFEIYRQAQWKLEFETGGIRLFQRGKNRLILWTEISSVETVSARTRSQIMEKVAIHLKSGEEVETEINFRAYMALNIRDEIKRRLQGAKKNS
jgi:hypothetical protein